MAADKSYILLSMVFFLLGAGTYLMFLGETAKSSYFPIRDILFTFPERVSPAGISQSRLDFFSERISVSSDRIRDPLVGLSWLIGEGISCDLVGSVLAYNTVLKSENVTLGSEGREKIREGLEAAVYVLNYTPDMDMYSDKLIEKIKQETLLNVSLDPYCVSSSYFTALKEYTEHEGNMLITEYISGSHESALYRSESVIVLKGLIKEGEI